MSRGSFKKGFFGLEINIQGMKEELSFWLSRKINYPITKPDVMQISVTYKCNLRCRMCSIVNLSPPEEELSTAKLLHVIDEAADYGIREILLTGGEPFLRRDIFQISDYVSSKGLRSILTTNGVLIDNVLAESIINSKLDHIHFSLDGLEATNDFFRGAGSFNSTVKAIRLLNEKRKNGRFISIGVALTVMDKNLNELSEIMRLVDDLGVDVINLQPLIKDNANFMDKNLPSFWPEDKDISVLKEEISKIRELKLRHLTIYEEPRLELLIKYYQSTLTKRDWVCFGGFKTVFISHSKGEPLVYSCHGICGNLDKDSLKSSWVSKEAHKLRLHSGNCRNLCMQSCYSREAAQNLLYLKRSCIRKSDNHG
ncbi:MAG: radical SAM protein [Candidatus Omnitrophica bacterium]|nr:radical SAM protein [Candidatus Omnitrophota bacterium]